MDDLYRTVRRVGTGRTALSALASVFLVASLCFWGVLHWTVFVVAGAGLPQVIVAVVMTLIYAFALPLLLSMLVPTTPAGQMLQKTQWKTIGFPVIIACASVLGWYARTLMLSWFAGQPAIREEHLEGSYALAAIIGFVVIPALAWVQVTPERWLQEIQQAHAAEKLRLLHSGELAIMKAQLVRIESQAAIGWANLLPAEQEEATANIKGLLMAISDNQRLIARTVGAQAAAERALGDGEIAESMLYVQQQLDKPARYLDRALAVEDEHEVAEYVEASKARSAAAERGRSADLARSDQRRSGDLSRSQISSADLRSPDRQKYEIAIQRLGLDVWDDDKLADTLAIHANTARKIRNEWRKAGLVESAGTEGRWRFTEHEEA